MVSSKRQYVISDGPAGAAFLTEANLDEGVILIAKKVEKNFNPRKITVKEAKELLNDVSK